MSEEDGGRPVLCGSWAESVFRQESHGNRRNCLHIVGLG